MPGRKFSAAGSGYRYGFNGKEKDNITGEGNLDFGARIYDSRLGRWLGVDAYTEKYPNVSPYTFCINSPIQFKDVNGHWLTDENGNIIYTYGQVAYEKSKDGKTLYEVRVYYFYTNDGQKVQAGRYFQKMKMKDIVWDDQTNWPKKGEGSQTAKRTDLPADGAINSSCHGNTLKLRSVDKYDLYIPGSGWDDEKNKDNVSKIYINTAEFTPINAEDVKPGDVAIFEDAKGNISHSATVTKVSSDAKNMKLTSKDDRNKVKKNQTLQQIKLQR